MPRNIDKNTLTEPHQESLPPLQIVVWFNEYTDLRQVSPYVATESDIWIVTDEAIDNTNEADDEFTSPVVGMALVKDGEVHRIAVAKDYRRNNIASDLIEKLHDEYGELRLECRVSLPANEFYDACGWELIEEKVANPENLNVWKRTPTE